VSTATKWLLAALAIPLLAGCDAGKEPLARAAAAEAAGSFAEAATLYHVACEKSPALCPVATRRAEALHLAEADKALDDGAYHQAKAAIDLALASGDPGVKRTAEAMSKLADLEKGLAWEDAAALDDKAAALAAIAPLAEAGVAVSPKAREWLAKNRPRLLLDQVKAACAPGGAGSCADLGAALARLHPGSSEATEAAALVDADLQRVVPLLQQAENLVGQRAMLWERDHKVETCVEAACSTAGDGPSSACTAEARPTCEQSASAERMPSVDFLAKAWRKKLDEIHDPHFVTRLEEGWARAERDGIHDAEPWPRPAGKK
jgi:hypothetical protein